MSSEAEQDARQRMADSMAAARDALVPLYDQVPGDHPQSILRDYPNSLRVIEALHALLDLMLPARRTRGGIGDHDLTFYVQDRLDQAWDCLTPEIARAIKFRWIGEAGRCEGATRNCQPEAEAERIMQAFVERLPELRELVITDIKAAYDGDPAALSYAEVQMSYPGVLALATHRLAHELYRRDVPIVPRVMSEWAHTNSGADLHPGARIGCCCFIDHATGVVVGETAEIGHNVKIYQGVTLGARSFPLDGDGHPIKHIKRHPTVEDDVVIYANAAILGGDTVIGANSTIGGSVFLMESVPPNSMVTNTHPELRIKSVEAE